MSFTSVFVLHIKTHMASKQIFKDRTSIFTPFVHLDIDLQQVYTGCPNKFGMSKVRQKLLKTIEDYQRLSKTIEDYLRQKRPYQNGLSTIQANLEF